MLKPNRKNNFAALLLFACLWASPAGAAAQGAYRVDEAKSPRCDFSEVPQITDPPSPLFVALERHKDAGAAVVVYGRPGTALRYAEGMKRWLTEMRGVTPERVSALYGGPDEDLRLELWIIPKGASPPFADASFAIQNLTLFETYGYWNGEYNMCGSGRGRALFAFADALRRRPGWQGRMVIRPHWGRAADEHMGPGGRVSRREAARRIARDKSLLVRHHGLPSSRIKAVVGAAGDWTHTELWLVPPDGGVNNSNKSSGAKNSNKGK